MKKIIYILFVILSFNVPAFAADWDDTSKEEVRDAFVQSLDVVKNKDIDKAVDALPPGFLKYFADLYKVSEAQLVPTFREIMKAGFEVVKTIELDLKPENIVYRQAPNGELFALIPYKTHAITVDDEAVDDDSISFAFKTNGRWYFVDLENAVNVDAIKAIYPQFKDVDFTIPDANQ